MVKRILYIILNFRKNSDPVVRNSGNGSKNRFSEQGIRFKERNLLTLRGKKSTRKIKYLISEVILEPVS